MYSDDDVERLYRICLLRGLGFSLNDIREVLDDPAWNLQAALKAHLHELDRRAGATARVRSRVSGLLAPLETAAAPVTADLLGAMEEMTDLEPSMHQRISILVYRDVEEAYEYLIWVFALGPGRLTRDEAGRVVHGEVQAGDGVVWLHPEREEFDLASPRSLGAGTSSVAVRSVTSMPTSVTRRPGTPRSSTSGGPALRLPRVRRPGQRRSPVVVHETARPTMNRDRHHQEETMTVSSDTDPDPHALPLRPGRRRRHGLLRGRVRGGGGRRRLARPDDGRVGHAQLRAGDMVFYLSDEYESL